MSAILHPLFVLFRFHKMKMLGALLIALFFVIVLFPKQDLSDYVSALVTQKTETYVRFDDLGFTFMPGLGISASEVLIEPRGLPPVKASLIEAAPAFLKLLTAKAGATVHAQDLFKGDVTVNYAQGSGTTHEIAVDADQVNLNELADFLRAAGISSLNLQGNLGLDAFINVDQTFKQQPSGNVSINIPAFVFPGQEVQMNMNGVYLPVALPTLNLGKVAMNVKLADRQLEIVNLDIGNAATDLSGKVKGNIGMNLQPTPVGVQPQVSKIEMRVDVLINKDFATRTPLLSSMLALINDPGCKQATDKGTRIACVITMVPGSQFPTYRALTEKL